MARCRVLGCKFRISGCPETNYRAFQLLVPHARTMAHSTALALVSSDPFASKLNSGWPRLMFGTTQMASRAAEQLFEPNGTLYQGHHQQHLVNRAPCKRNSPGVYLGTKTRQVAAITSTSAPPPAFSMSTMSRSGDRAAGTDRKLSNPHPVVQTVLTPQCSQGSSRIRLDQSHGSWS